MAQANSADLAFMADVRALAQQGPGWAAIASLATITLFFVTALIWAAVADLDQQAKGQGRVIPSSQVQTIQNLEGGIVTDILVREGDEVQSNQVLLRLDPTSAAANLGVNRAEYLGLIAAITRLDAEIAGTDLSFPDELMREDPSLASRERALYLARRNELNSAISILQQQRQQRAQELRSLQGEMAGLDDSHRLVGEEIGLIRPMVEKGVAPRVELLRLERQAADIEGRRQSTRQAIPRARAAMTEAARRIKERRQRFEAETLAERNELNVRLSALTESRRALEDRVTRTEVRSPVHGVVKRISVTTIGGVVDPGQPLAEVVPLEDTLLVEARIRPDDIAFLSPGQPAKVKITAYDSLQYGALEATLDHIGADSVLDEQGNSFYEIRVRTARNHLGTDAQPLPIIPGMVAEIDILTGKKTVLEYLLKPILRARENAMTER